MCNGLFLRDAKIRLFCITGKLSTNIFCSVSVYGLIFSPVFCEAIGNIISTSELIRTTETGVY